MTTRPAQTIYMQKAQQLGRPITYEDIGDNPIREQFTLAATRGRGWRRPTITSSVPVLARMDGGRWLADCPSGCNGAELVSESDPVFLCLSCGSEGKWWPVKFPANKAAIDTEVTKRRDIMDWAWTPGETLTMLRAETKRIKD